VRGFLGLVGYYRKFGQDFGMIAAPLTALLKKEGFTWTEASSAAFEALKKAVTTTPVLGLPNFSLPFVVESTLQHTALGLSFSRISIPLHSSAIQQRHTTNHWPPMSVN
jgi:hypothetical protein